MIQSLLQFCMLLILHAVILLHHDLGLLQLPQMFNVGSRLLSAFRLEALRMELHFVFHSRLLLTDFVDNENGSMFQCSMPFPLHSVFLFHSRKTCLESAVGGVLIIP